jgi:hypothetical protein
MFFTEAFMEYRKVQMDDCFLKGVLGSPNEQDTFIQ